MTEYFIIPGFGNSGDEHWQTFFEKEGNNFRRINQENWEFPNCDKWVENIENTLLQIDLSNVVLVGHSLGCATIAKWATTHKNIIKGALFVAPSDMEIHHEDYPTIGFDPMPSEKLDFKSILVASSDDPFMTIERAKYFAEKWNSEFVNIGNAGHINATSGYGQWKEGLEILKKLG
jgi:uncharacterized protein